MAPQWMWQLGRVEPSAIADSRRSFARLLRDRGCSEDQIDAAVMIFGELVANACEHGGVPVEVVLYAKGQSLELRVVDAGGGFRLRERREPESLRGRGLKIVRNLGGRVSVIRGRRSGVRVVLSL